MNYGEKFKHVRTLRGLSLTVLSNKCGLSAPYLSQIENSKKRPSMKSLENIAKALNADTSFFMDDNVTKLSELTKVSGYEPPSEIMKFVTDERNLPYLLLAKQMFDENITAETCEVIFNSVKQIMRAMRNPKE